MPASDDDTFEKEAIERLVNVAKHFPISIYEWLEFDEDLDPDTAPHRHARDAIRWAFALRSEAAQTVRAILAKRPGREDPPSSAEAAPRDEH